MPAAKLRFERLAETHKYAAPHDHMINGGAIWRALVALKECMIVLGMLLGYVVGYCLTSTTGGWRYTYLVSAGPAVAMFLGVARLPAPPR